MEPNEQQADTSNASIVVRLAALEARVNQLELRMAGAAFGGVMIAEAMRYIIDMMQRTGH